MYFTVPLHLHGLSSGFVIDYCLLKQILHKQYELSYDIELHENWSLFSVSYDATSNLLELNYIN